MKRLLAATLLCLVGTMALADVPIPKDYRPMNRDPGRCAWCALEALGRYHGYENMKGLSDRNDRVGFRHWYEDELKKHKVKYEIQEWAGPKLHRWKLGEYTIDTYDTAWIEWASNKEYGCAVGLWEKGWKSKHMVILTEFDKKAKTVKIIDSNNRKKETETVSLAWFLYWWDGMTIIIYPKE